jgi:outer membrane murein-binding lipoprotein Lpp
VHQIRKVFVTGRANNWSLRSCEFIVASMATMNGHDHRSEIVRLEAQIEELEATIESCRKFILAGRIAVASGGVILIFMLVGAIQINPSVMAVAVAAVLGGIVAAGSNHSTAREAASELTALEAKRAMLIGQLELRLVPERDGQH